MQRTASFYRAEEYQNRNIRKRKFNFKWKMNEF